MAYQLLDLKKFLSRLERDVNTENPIPFTWLIGAGFSASAGIPLAQEVSHILVLYEFIGENKATEFEHELPGVGYDQKQLKAYIDWYYHLKTTDPMRYESLINEAYQWLSTIEHFQSITKESPECYQALFTHLLKYKSDHHYFLTNIIQRVKGINVAHIGLAGLLRDYPKWGHTVFTTNFDDLLLRSVLSLNHTARIFGEVNSIEIPSLIPSYPQIVHLHGRHTGYNLLNTRRQISEWYDPSMKDAFAKHIFNSNLIIVGYSGWDDMVMQTLKNWDDNNENLIRGNLYWIPYHNENNLDPKVSKFLNSCPPLKTFVITNQEKNLNADSFILSFCNSINKKNGSFAIYRKDILETAKAQHSFILEQLNEYPDYNPQAALRLVEDARKKIEEAEITKSTELLEEALKLVMQPDLSSELKAEAGKDIGVLFYKLGHIEKAKAILTESLEHFGRILNKDAAKKLNLCENQRVLGEIYISQDLFNEAYHLVREAIYLAKQVLGEDKNNRTAKVHLLFAKLCRAYIHLLKGNHNAIDLDLREIDEMIDAVTDKFNFLGKLYQVKGCYSLVKNDFKDSVSYFDRSTEFFSKTNNIKNILLNQVYSSYLALKDKNFGTAEMILRKALEEFTRLGDETGMSICFSAIGYFNSRKNDADKELVEGLYRKAAESFRQNNSNYNRINVLVDLYSLKSEAGYPAESKAILDTIEEINIKPHQYFKTNRKDGE